jgi:universal stress protein A
MNVLLPVDGSPSADAAVAAFIKQFNPENTVVRVLHVVEQPLAVPDTLAFAEAAAAADVVAARLDERRRQGQQIVDRTVAKLQAAHFHADAEIHEGEARREVLAASNNWPADAIVMGSHGRHGFDRLVMGSVAEHVLRHAPCSVEIVRPALAAV